MLFLETGSPAKSLSTKTVVLVFEIATQIWVSEPNIALHISVEYGRIREVHIFSGPNAPRLLQNLNCLGKNMKSLMHANLYRVGIQILW